MKRRPYYDDGFNFDKAAFLRKAKCDLDAGSLIAVAEIYESDYIVEHYDESYPEFTEQTVRFREKARRMISQGDLFSFLVFDTKEWEEGMFLAYDRESFYELSEEFGRALEGPDLGVDGSCTGLGKRNEVPDERSRGCARSREYAVGGEQGPISTPDVRDDISSEPENADQDEEIFDIEYTSRVRRRIRRIRHRNES